MSQAEGPSGLNDAEKRVVAAAADGIIAFLTNEERVRADIVRALICREGFEGGEPWPMFGNGVHIVGGAMTGTLLCPYRTINVQLILRDMTIEEDVILTGAETRSVSLDGSHLKGCLYIDSANIRGQLRCRKTRFEKPGSEAIYAESCSVVDVHLSDSEVIGECYFARAKLEGQFIGDRSKFTNPGGKALVLEGASLQLLALNATTVDGVCSISGATIRADFAAVGSYFSNPADCAIEAANAQIRSMYLNAVFDEKGALITPTKVFGSIRLVHATLGSIEIVGAEISTGRSAAVIADAMVVEGSFTIGNGAKIDGAILLTGSGIKSLSFFDATITSANLARARSEAPLRATESLDAYYTYLAVSLLEAKVETLVMPREAAHRPRGIFDLGRAKVGSFWDFAAAWPEPVDRRSRGCVDRACTVKGTDADHLILDGFEYEHLGNPDGEPESTENTNIVAARLRWLHAQSRDVLFKRFSPQPWKQLAKVLSLQGYEEEARKISIERRVAIRHAEGSRWYQNFVSSILHTLSDYGFNPWKSVWWSLGIVAIFGAIYYTAALTCTSREPLCADQTAFVRVVAADFVPAIQDEAEAAKTLARVYPAFDPMLYSLDAFLPLFNLGTEPYWRPNENLRVDIAGTSVPAGRFLQWLYVIEQILGAVLASLIVTGFTGLLTRDER